MPNFTPNFSLVKPLGTEQFDEANDNNNMDILDTQLKAVADRVTALEALPTEFTNKITASAGYTVDTQSLWKLGRIIIVHFQFTRTGASINSPADGNMVNSEMGIIAAGYRPGTRVSWATSTTGPGQGGYISETGQVVLAWTVPSQDILTNDVMTGSATFLQVN